MCADRLRTLIRAHRQLFAGAVVALSILMWAGIGGAAWLAGDILTGLPDQDALRGVSTMAQATTILDAHDKPAFTIFREQRIEIQLDRMSPHLVRAMLAIEDQRFYDHAGVDFIRMVGAAVTNVREGRVAQGGSTITQQLARQSFLTRDKTLQRKLKEIVVAARLEGEFSKDEILRLYLNKVYFGDGLYGAEAASLGFFGKHAADLDVAEAALLAGLVKSPSTYAPTISPELAVARRNVVLQAMRAAGALDAGAYDAARRAPVNLQDALRHEEAYGQYFKEEVRKALVEKFGWERVYQEGLRVYTTIDLDMQKLAEAEVQRGLEEIEQRRARRGTARRPADEPLQAALVAVDPATGEVRAMVGGRDFAESRFNRAVQARRQPGSAFKPFVYAAALERGYSPATMITNLHDPVLTIQGAWVPEDEHLETSAMTMRTALRTSSNRAAVRMLQQVGIPETVQHAERLGIGSVPSVPSLALGSGEVTLVSMTAAYTAFANTGLLSPPVLIRRVETTDGEIVFEAVRRPQRAVSEATAFIMTTMMADVINAGTAWQARRVGFAHPAAGKTGTTNEYHDVWFVGYTPKLAAGVWIGYDQPRTILTNGYAGDLAVPIWGRFMKAATSADKPEWFRAPATVSSMNVCRISGKLPVDGCRHVVSTTDEGTLNVRSQVYTEYFVRGTEPIDFCPVHGRAGFGDLIVGTGGDVIMPPPAETAAPAKVAGPVPAEPDAPPAAAQPEPKKKRGFWARFFGIGKDEKKTPKSQPPTPKPRRPH
ncbi:MAG: penicillin-binding protein 1A [Vicinamibacterales bacterium]